MSRHRYTPEFKDEAVRQVTEKGHSVQEVAARLGVSSHSLYKWVKAVRPEKDEGDTPDEQREPIEGEIEDPHQGERHEDRQEVREHAERPESNAREEEHHERGDDRDRQDV